MTDSTASLGNKLTIAELLRVVFNWVLMTQLIIQILNSISANGDNDKALNIRSNILAPHLNFCLYTCHAPTLTLMIFYFEAYTRPCLDFAPKRTIKLINLKQGLNHLYASIYLGI